MLTSYEIILALNRNGNFPKDFPNISLVQPRPSAYFRSKRKALKAKTRPWNIRD